MRDPAQTKAGVTAVKARRRGTSFDGGDESGSGAHAGKRTRSEGLAGRSHGSTEQPSPSAPLQDEQVVDRSTPGPFADDDPFGMHLVGQPVSRDGDEADDAPEVPLETVDSEAEALSSPVNAEPIDLVSPMDDGPAAGDTATAAPASFANEEEPDDASHGAADPVPGAPEPLNIADRIEPPEHAAATPGASSAVADVARTQAGLIQASAAAEYQSAIAAIGQREQVMRGAFTQQRATIRNVGATQAALARSDAKQAAGRVRGRNGTVAQTITRAIDHEIARLSLGTQDAMARVSAASRTVTKSINVAADGALASANLELQDATDGQLAHELYARVVLPAQTASRREAQDARSRDIDRLASARDRNTRELRRAGDLLAQQVSSRLPDVERSMVAAGEQLAAVIERNAKSQTAAIDASERGAAAFFARARVEAHRLLEAGRATADSVTAAAAAQPGGTGAAARFEGASAVAAAQLGARRERLVTSIDAAATGAAAALSQGVVTFQAECDGHRSTALANHAAVEARLAGEVAGKMEQARAGLSEDVDMAIVSGNSYAAFAEHNAQQAIAALPSKFGGMVRSAFSEARKSRLRRFGEGAWSAVAGLVTTVAKFVAALLAITFAPLAFGIAALLGKAGELAGLIVDAVKTVAAMADAFAERFRILFRTWDDWPWYGKAAGLWATTLVAIGDVIGIPSIYEGVSGRELISNRELTFNERGSKTAGGGLAVLSELGPMAYARRASLDVPGPHAPEPVVTAADEVAPAPAAAPKPDGALKPVLMAGDELDLHAYVERIKPEPGTLDVVLHGSVDDFYVVRNGKRITIENGTLALYIKKSGQKFDRVRLISCETGVHAKGAAQHLANKLDVEVVAPTDKVHIHADGSLTVGPRDYVHTGQWEVFTPTKSELRYTRAKEPAPETVRDRLARRREAKAEKEAAAGAPDAAVAPESTGAPKTMGRVDEPDIVGAGRTVPEEAAQLVDSSKLAAASADELAALGAAGRAEAHRRLMKIEVEFAEKGSSPAIERDTYFVKPADGAVIAQLVQVVKPGTPIRTYKKGVLVGGGAEAWYFEFHEQAGQLGGQRAAAVSAADGGVGLPASNVATVEIWGFRGVREIKKPGDARPRKEPEWTPEERAEVKMLTTDEPLLGAGHAAISVDGGKTIRGWTPVRPDGMSLDEIKQRLSAHEAFPGTFGDDTAVFTQAENAAEHLGWNTEVTRVVELVEKPQRHAILQEMDRIEGATPDQHGQAYSWPLRQPADGQHFAASNGYAAHDVRNCAAFLEKLGVALPEPSGNMNRFVPALEEWAEADGPIDARPKEGTP